MVAILKLFVGDRRAFWKTESSADYPCAKKKDDAAEVEDFRPISLVHSFGKRGVTPQPASHKILGASSVGASMFIDLYPRVAKNHSTNITCV
jgi:hypothetical protein